VLDPARLRLLGELQQPGSAAGLARRLSLPRQKVNYHLRELEKAGLVRLVEERRKGNCVERVVQATATSYVIDPGILGPLAADPDRIEDRLSSAYLVAVAAKAIRELAELRARAGAAKKPLATFTLQVDVRFATPEDRSAFAEELATSVAQLVREYHTPGGDDGGRLHRFFVGGYPAITRPRSDSGRHDTTPPTLGEAA
jgi:DNA-binding transcriptional ArsR family regulator